MISFKSAHFPKDVILYAVFFYVRYSVSYRDLEEIMEERVSEENMPAYNQFMALAGELCPQISAALHFMNICDRTKKSPSIVHFTLQTAFCLGQPLIFANYGLYFSESMANE